MSHLPIEIWQSLLSQFPHELLLTFRNVSSCHYQLVLLEFQQRIHKTNMEMSELNPILLAKIIKPMNISPIRMKRHLWKVMMNQHSEMHWFAVFLTCMNWSSHELLEYLKEFPIADTSACYLLNFKGLFTTDKERLDLLVLRNAQKLTTSIQCFSPYLSGNVNPRDLLNIMTLYLPNRPHLGVELNAFRSIYPFDSKIWSELQIQLKKQLCWSNDELLSILQQLRMDLCSRLNTVLQFGLLETWFFLRPLPDMDVEYIILQLSPEQCIPLLQRLNCNLYRLGTLVQKKTFSDSDIISILSKRNIPGPYCFSKFLHAAQRNHTSCFNILVHWTNHRFGQETEKAIQFVHMAILSLSSKTQDHHLLKNYVQTLSPSEKFSLQIVMNACPLIPENVMIPS